MSRHHRAPRGPKDNYLDDSLPPGYGFEEFGPDFLVTKCPSYTEKRMLSEMFYYDPQDYGISQQNAYVIRNIVKNLEYAISFIIGRGGNPQIIRENIYEIFDKRLKEFTPQHLEDPDYRKLINCIKIWRSMVEVPTINSMEIPQGPE